MVSLLISNKQSQSQQTDQDISKKPKRVRFGGLPAPAPGELTSFNPVSLRPPYRTDVVMVGSGGVDGVPSSCRLVRAFSSARLASYARAFSEKSRRLSISSDRRPYHSASGAMIS